MTPLQLVLIAIVVGFLCLFFKDMVEADTSQSPNNRSKKTCKAWLKGNKSKCNPVNPINFEDKPCGGSYSACNKDTCCADNAQDEQGYCTDFVTKDSNEYDYCIKRMDRAYV